jgi:octaheme c-type cytochrome (tetrathionate reductase family)
MKDFKYIWIAGLIVTFSIVIIPILLLISADAESMDDPWASVPKDQPHTDHSSLIQGPFATGQDVTTACLTCHEDAAHEVVQTTHWTWQALPVEVEGRDEPVSIGKANILNNFCIGIQSNWQGCTRCHAGYGWDSADFDFSNEGNVDCLVCHDQSGIYVKGTAGNPAADVDLVAAAQSVGLPTRENCGGCHFEGGGGNGVKHGDLDASLYFPPENVDVHMGRHNFECTDCHRTEDHQIRGRAISVSYDNANQLYCTNCHDEDLHNDERIDDHLATVACQTCHVPAGAIREPTKMEWDWSTAGQDLQEDPRVYLKIKGSFIYEKNFIPEYNWYNGTAQHYLLGDLIDPTQPTYMNNPNGDINDLTAKIWPFKIHRARQIYDAVYNYLLQPKTVGEGGYWTDFDWNQAVQLGSEATGLPYSGQYSFAPTLMYWPLTHMVAPAENALQCTDCHGENGRMDWQALGYYGDPMIWGGRSR